ncbi:hypothetical protein GHT06_020903 [Daphnia sinensis]|uniref:Uncharacterized protein n=1 Tax=Daphnia sinensis TaxID=1820382 RepID=A0AAD5KZF5_9CRUS|nr:hypothetical protein GHT06_020903 [Daphnia sinensis]
MTGLRKRFNGSASGLHRLLRYLGLDSTTGSSKWKTKLWGSIVFFVMSQAGLYVFVMRSLPHFKGFLVKLNATIVLFDRLTRFLCGYTIQLVLLLKLDRFLDSFCNQLNPVDVQLCLPKLSGVRRVAIAGVVWILFVCNSQAICATYVELVESNRKHSISLLERLQQFIRLESYMILDVSVLIFCTSGELLVIFYRQLAKDVILRPSSKEFFRFSSISTQLSVTTAFLRTQFSTVLLINCIHSSVCLLLFSDALISELRNPNLKITAVWTSITLVDCLVRLWLICHTADRICNANHRCIRSLRRLRDYTILDINPSYQRNQITLAILEIPRTMQHFRLFGMITLSKELVLGCFLVELTATVTLLGRLARVFSACTIHLVLLLKLDRFLDSFCNQLSLVDTQLCLPKSSGIRRFAIAGVVWILFECNSHAICATYVELVESDRKHSILLLERLQQFIRLEGYLVLDTSVVIFCTSGELLVIFYRQLAEDIFLRPSSKEFFRYSFISTQLSVTTAFLQTQFSTVLLVNCIHSSVCLLIFSDALMSELQNPNLKITAVWTSVTLVGSLVRLWLVCYTADKICNAPERDYTILDINPWYQRNQYRQTAIFFFSFLITLAIVEIPRTLPHFKLFGMITLSKDLVLVLGVIMLNELKT